MTAPATSTATEPGDALRTALKENAREIGVLALGMTGYPTRLAEKTYDQDPEVQKLFLELAAAQMRRTVKALGQDWATIARSAGLAG